MNVNFNRCCTINQKKINSGELKVVNMDGHKFIFPKQFEGEVKKIFDRAASGQPVKFIEYVS